MFETTVWSRIEAAQRDDPAAVEQLVARYRPPLLRYIERWAVDGASAEDLAQEVLLELFGRGALARADKERGRFRAYLLTIAKNVLRKARRHQEALKRGGGARTVHVSDEGALPAPEPDDGEFDRLWAEHLLQRALDELAGKNPRQREALRLRFDRGLAYEAIAAEMGRTLQQVKNDIHRGREQVKEAVLRAIAGDASSREEYDAEVDAFRRFVRLWGGGQRGE